MENKETKLTSVSPFNIEADRAIKKMLSAWKYRCHDDSVDAITILKDFGRWCTNQRPAQPDSVVAEAEAFIGENLPSRELTLDNANAHLAALIAALKAANEEIERLKAPWISVEDALPEPDKTQMVFVLDKRGVYSACYWLNCMFTTERDDEVTHWMPIPELPK